ncbi:MAG TPA: tetratricopeptide repeat protein, partial [Chthonomonadales bacterium]|nr:tetratricopeptide repeat protein [Chthonomonadales bacterium]
AYTEIRDMQSAIVEFERALEINADYVEARLNLALALRDLGREIAASEHFQRVLQIEPDNPIAREQVAKHRAGVRIAERPVMATGQ